MYSLPVVEPKLSYSSGAGHESVCYDFRGLKIIQYIGLPHTNAYFMANADITCEFMKWEIGLENLSTKIQEGFFFYKL